MRALSPAAWIFTVFRDATGGEVIDGTVQTLSWDTEVIEDTDIPLLAGDTDFDMVSWWHYLVMYSVPVNSTSGANRSETQTWLRLNSGTNLSYGRGSAYIRRVDGDDDWYNEGAAVIDVAPNDTIELQIQRTSTNTAWVQRTANRSGINILKLDDTWEYARLRSSVNQTVNTSWTDVLIDTEDELDAGNFSRAGTDLTLSQQGHYLITYNVWFTTTGSDRKNNETRLTLDGIELEGTRSVAYIRAQEGSFDGIASYVGIIETNSVNQILNLETFRESTLQGTTNEVNSNLTGLTVTKLPDTADYIRLWETWGGQDMTQVADTPVTFDTVLEQDATKFDYSPINPSEIEVKVDGDFMFFHSLYNTRIGTGNGLREAPFIEWILNSVGLWYGNSWSYNRQSSDGDGITNSSASSAGIIIPAMWSTDVIELWETNEWAVAAGVYTADRMWIQWVDINSLFTSKPFMSQHHFRFRDDANDLDANSGWLASEDTEVEDIVKWDTVRLRMSLANRGTQVKSSDSQYRMQWWDAVAWNCSSVSTWNDIQTWGDAWDIVWTTHISPSPETSSNNYLANTEWYSFIETQWYDDVSGLTSVISGGTFTIDSFLEYEFALQPSVYAVTGNRYCFRLYDELWATELDAYEYPSVRIADNTILPNVNWGEAGTISAPANGWWTTLSYVGWSYSDPIIVWRTNTHNDLNEALVFESRNVTSTTAEVRLCDSNAGNATGCQAHAIETIWYIVVDAARTWNIAWIEAGKFSVDQSFDVVAWLKAINYNETFSTVPYVFWATQTTNGPSPIVARINVSNVSWFSGWICQQNSQDACNAAHTTETFGWIAIDPTADPFTTENELGSGVSNATSNIWSSATFATAFTTIPAVITQTVTNNGGQDVQVDEAQLVTTTGMQFRSCEIDNDDDCDTHAVDTIRWLAIEQAVFGQVLGDSNALDQTHYRFYNNANSDTPWGALVAENTTVSTLPLNWELRLRMLLQNGINTLSDNSLNFKLQYAAGANCSVISTWSDVGNPWWTGDWLFLDNANPVNWDIISSSLLFWNTHITQSYNEQNPTLVNPNSLLAWERWEWDFSIVENWISALSQYCFRVVTGNDQEIYYSEYPLVNFTDLDPPVITSGFPSDNMLVPIGNFDLQYEHTDVLSGVNTWTGFTEDIVIQRWNGSSYDPDIAPSVIDFPSKTFTLSGSTYPIIDLSYGRYQFSYTIQDNAGNSATDIREIYIDYIEFNVSRSEVNMWDLWITNNLYDSIDDLVITVQSVWASFDLTMLLNTPLQNASSTFPYWDGTEWIWYRETPFTGVVNDFSSGAVLLSQAENINANGDKNVYTYTLKYALLIQQLDDYVAADDYVGSVDFNVDFAY